MKSRSIGYALGVLGWVLLAGCGSGSGSNNDAGGDDGSPGSGVAVEAGAPCHASGGADGGRGCGLAMPVQGALTGTLDGQTGCGAGTGTSYGDILTWMSSALGVGVRAGFQNGLPQQAGTYPVDSLNIGTPQAADGGSLSWTVPAGACTITVVSTDIECQSVFDQYKTVLHGTGTCTRPAAPDPGTSAGPITIGDFTFEHWL